MKTTNDQAGAEMSNKTDAETHMSALTNIPGAVLTPPVSAVPKLPDLYPVITWLEGGCDPLDAAKELRIYQKQVGGALPPEPQVKVSAVPIAVAPDGWRAALQQEHDAQTQHYAEIAAVASAGSRMHMGERDCTEGVILGVQYCINRLDELEKAAPQSSAVPVAAGQAEEGQRAILDFANYAYNRGRDSLGFTDADAVKKFAEMFPVVVAAGQAQGDAPFCYMSENYEVGLFAAPPLAGSGLEDMFPVYRHPAALQSPPISEKVAVKLGRSQAEVIAAAENNSGCFDPEFSGYEVRGLVGALRAAQAVADRTALSQPPAVEAPSDDIPSRDWSEDFQHENGQYEGKCITCEHRFIGHKRRVTCKTCAALPAPLPKAEAASDKKPRVFVDMDGVIVDFGAYASALGLTGDEVKKRPGAYLEMPAFPGAIEAVRSLIGMGYEVWIATKPPTGIAFAYADKAAWIIEHLPELKRRIIITHDKGLLGCASDYLIDDRPHKANCETFTGTLIPFVDETNWPVVLDMLRKRSTALAPSAVQPTDQELIARLNVWAEGRPLKAQSKEEILALFEGAAAQPAQGTQAVPEAVIKRAGEIIDALEKATVPDILLKHTRIAGEAFNLLRDMLAAAPKPPAAHDGGGKP